MVKNNFINVYTADMVDPFCFSIGLNAYPPLIRMQIWILMIVYSTTDTSITVQVVNTPQNVVNVCLYSRIHRSVFLDLP